jgi:hypothetical protein
MRHFFRKERGNALIMVALSFAVLAAFGVLTIDIGRILVTRTQLQNAADAGALAGASLFCENQGLINVTDADIQNRVRLVGGANKALEEGAEFVTIENDQIVITRDLALGTGTVEVNTLSNTSQYFLGVVDIAAKLAGPKITQALVRASATAMCGATCNVSCVKPWSPPDRWDDVTPIPGYFGNPRNGRPNWNNNRTWDSEDFTDQDGDFLYDNGEPFADANGNGAFDQELYHQSLTGYNADPQPGNLFAPLGDIGTELTLKSASPSIDDPPQPGWYYPVDLPPLVHEGVPGSPEQGADVYRWNIANCNESAISPGDILRTAQGMMTGPTNQGMRDLIALDPGAYWDPVTESVKGSAFDVSPRIVLIPLHDPRIPAGTGRSQLVVVKVAAFFMESMEGNASVRGKFLKVRAPGTACPPGQVAGGFTYSLSLID